MYHAARRRPVLLRTPWNGSLPAGTGKSTDVDLTDVNKPST